MTIANWLTRRDAERHAADGTILRNIAVNLTALIGVLESVKMATEEGREALADMRLRIANASADASFAADDADERAQATIERNAA